MARKNLKEWRAANKDKIAAQNKAWYEKHYNAYYEKNKKRIAAKQAAWRKTEKGLEYVRNSSKRRAKRSPKKVRAREALRKAVAAGKIEKKPCRDCGSTKAEGHHFDYSRPLAVIWLCKTHHRAEHGVVGF